MPKLGTEEVVSRLEVVEGEGASFSSVQKDVTEKPTPQMVDEDIKITERSTVQMKNERSLAEDVQDKLARHSPIDVSVAVKDVKEIEPEHPDAIQFYSGSWAIQPEFSFPMAAVVTDNRSLETIQSEITIPATVDITEGNSVDMKLVESDNLEPASTSGESADAQTINIADEPIQERAESMITRSIEQPVARNNFEDPATIQFWSGAWNSQPDFAFPTMAVTDDVEKTMVTRSIEGEQVKGSFTGLLFIADEVQAPVLTSSTLDITAEDEFRSTVAPEYQENSPQVAHDDIDAKEAVDTQFTGIKKNESIAARNEDVLDDLQAIDISTAGKSSIVEGSPSQMEANATELTSGIEASATATPEVATSMALQHSILSPPVIADSVMLGMGIADSVSGNAPQVDTITAAAGDDGQPSVAVAIDATEQQPVSTKSDADQEEIAEEAVSMTSSGRRKKKKKRRSLASTALPTPASEEPNKMEQSIEIGADVIAETTPPFKGEKEASIIEDAPLDRTMDNVQESEVVAKGNGLPIL